MKLTDFIQDAGRPVAYYPQIARAVGGVKQGILVCQLLYWSDKGSSGEGWIYKSQAEIEDETGLSRREQETARKSLVKAGILRERYERLSHRMYFQVNTDRLNQVWDAFAKAEAKAQKPQWRKAPFPNGGKRHSGKAESAIRTTQITYRETVPNSKKSKYVRNSSTVDSIDFDSQENSDCQYFDSAIERHFGENPL